MYCNRLLSISISKSITNLWLTGVNTSVVQGPASGPGPGQAELFKARPSRAAGMAYHGFWPGFSVVWAASRGQGH